jgi:energy-coupling factor transporter transmembrane protein EcfT
MLFTVLVFIVDSPVIAAVQMLFFIALCLLAKIPLKKIFPHFKFLLFLMMFVISLQILFGHETPESRYLLRPLFPDRLPLIGGRGSLKLDGLFTGLMISCRILALTALLPVLTMTTEARMLAYGLTRLGVPYRAAHVITSTLTMIPVFEEETRFIIEARKLRGVQSLDNGNFFAKVKEYSALALPLMIKAMRKAQIAGLAMDSRAFGAHKTRTWLLEARFTPVDYAVYAAGIGYTVMVIAVIL